ncbi:MAG: hypothetical protein LCH79_20265 [Proteobacteria bacterium]|jgi:hypothetical protein|nr:hypothetical protein [Pseudomonadota bacterium]
MDTLTERAVRTLLFIAGLFTLPALAPDMALMLGGYQALMGVLALALLGVAAVLLRAARREARWNNPALAKPPQEDH